MRNLNLLVLRCRDVEQSRAFYECFDMHFTKHAHGSGPEHYAHEDERGVFELYPLKADEVADRTGLGFRNQDLGSIAERLSHAGFSPGDVQETAWGTSFVVRDPDGRRIEVKQA